MEAIALAHDVTEMTVPKQFVDDAHDRLVDKIAVDRLVDHVT